MPQTYTFNTLLNEFRNTAASERDKGDRFERLIKNYLLTDPVYETVIEQVYLWEEFPFRDQFGGSDIGIDLVTKNFSGDYWAVQCKCYQANAYIDKASVDSFLSTSGRSFKNNEKQLIKFTDRLWVSTTNNWSANAEETLKNQDPPVSRINLTNLNESAVDWTQIANGVFGKQARITQKTLRPHQTEALNATITSFETAERGKLIMACGTGKTFTSLKIAEAQAPANGLVLFLVPSIALLGQTLREWTAESERPIQAICICSDARVSRQKVETDDGDNSVVDLAMPASTNVKTIVRQLNSRQNRKDQLTVVFSTYQSIEVIAEAQRTYNTEYGSESGVFDLIICDEAHRTTGVTVADTDESAFVKVHDNSFIQSRKRLYMTATPRLFDDNSKAKAALNEAELCSMDDEALYGEELYRIGFGEAVEKGLLSDYKVLILTLKEGDVPLAVQKMLANEEAEITTDDASKLIGCINALSKKLLGDNKLIQENDPQPMKRAVAFCRSIAESKTITNTFNATQGVYHEELPDDERNKTVHVSSKHIDGTMNAPTRDEMLAWLKEPSDDPLDCRVLTNVRCLSEGVDVPSLDAVMFLSARNSQVDVVQSVGRVMRKAPGKNFGYIIIPVIVPSNVEADKALDNNERFRVVWTVLNALRAHDDRFNAIVNKIELNKQRPSQILMTRPDTAYATEYGEHPNERNQTVAEQQEAYQRVQDEINQQLALQFEELQSVVFAKLVKKVGDRRYWEQWAKDIAIIAERYIERITRLITQDDTYADVFQNFLTGLRKNINPAISEGQAIEMLAQHIITKPVFDALFEGYSFVENNAISVAMQQMVTLLEDQNVDKDTEILDRFYDSVRKRASGIDNAEGKQRIIIELYDKFFKTAFPKMVEQLGIVYTPVEVVDFIIHSVNDVLKKEFDRSVSDENVHVLDPFTGTGTFITRLLQSGLIKPEDLPRKYKHELHANELVLLAYYIAAVNIENAYHDALNSSTLGESTDEATAYESFDGICLTDTFQLSETDGSDELFSDVFPKNSERVEQQKKAPLRVIMGNPPYSVGQKSANDNAQNQTYEKLDSRIVDTYAKLSKATSVKALYDSYIKAFRWSTDRLDPVNGGVIAFVSNGAWLDGNSTAGFRKTLEQEFDSINVFNLRGNAWESGLVRKKEAGNVFGSGSRTQIAITILVKKGNAKTKLTLSESEEKAKIYYHDIGDYLKQEEKLAIIRKFGSVVNPQMKWKTLQPNDEGDWLNQRNEAFSEFIQLNADKKFDGKSTSFFITHSLGTATSRDAWVFNSSLVELMKNIVHTISFYNDQRQKFVAKKGFDKELDFKDFASNDTTKISWNDSLRNLCEKNAELSEGRTNLRVALYRPFFKTNLYFEKNLIQRPYQIPKLFPNPSLKNLVICVSANYKDGSVLITNQLPDLHFNGDTQAFPLYYYEEQEQQDLFSQASREKYIRRDGVSDFILEKARKQYGKTVTKEDIFYYVYGFLHSPNYRITFANDLKKMLPRLPLVDDVRDFYKFSNAGRKLADLHINYEAVEPYEGEGFEVHGLDGIGSSSPEMYRVQKMRFPKKGQQDTIIYNSKITISGIPEKAYEYVVNGKSAIDWIMERYQVKTDKNSGIKNDPNDWAKEVGNPSYILDLLLSIINVSVQTVDIVNGLPEVEFE